ncbi:MAG: hypothetical protein ACLFQV_05590 [Vulcanimicrobiota bacterium]
MKKLIVLILITVLFLVFANNAYCREHKDSPWDRLAKKILLTVPQENELKKILMEEKEQILECRNQYGAKIVEILGRENGEKWHSTYVKIKNKADFAGAVKKQLLLNPFYLIHQYKADNDTQIQLENAASLYYKRVKTIREETYDKIEKILGKAQMKIWYEEINNY